MVRFSRFIAVGLLTLTACGARADETEHAPPPAAVAPDAAKVPAALRDLPYVAGIAGNDIVHAETLAQIVRQSVKARDFAALNEMETYFRTTRSRLPGGTWELDAFHEGVQKALTGPQFADTPCALKGTEFTEAWARYDPAQPSAYIAEAALHLDYGWCIRGTGYTDSVDPSAWKPFKQHVDTAYAVLSGHAAAAKRDPEFYALMERIYTAQGRSRADFQALLDQGSAAEPYYYGIYFQAALHALPQWGGSIEEADRIARYAVERTREKDGAGAYARIYWSLMNCGCDVRDFAIDRDMLARAMDDVFARTPSDWNAANFAKIACRLGERDLTRQQFARGGREDGFEWGDPDEWRKCRQFAGLK